MAKKQTSGAYTKQEFEESLDVTFQALLNQEVQRLGLDINSYELFNQLLLQDRRKRLYKDGKAGPISALRLHLEAERSTGHSAKLWRNMRNAAKQQGLQLLKSCGFESHHVVAARHQEAWQARDLIFSIGIGINDYRNGVNIRKSPEHQELHADFTYYLRVYNRLNRALAEVGGESTSDKNERVGNELIDISDEIEQGIF